MNRAMIAAGTVIILAIGLIFLLRDDPEPEPPPAAAGPPPAPRIVPKKLDSDARPAAPRKAAPKKTEPAPAAPAATAALTLASLTLESDVPGASVFIDRAFVGNTPLTLDKLEPGSKRVQLTATGFDSVQKTIDLNPGPNAITIRVKEVSLSARTAVVHKHGVGSCDGTLSATLDGLRYDSANKGDAFTLSYAQVEQFAVDYLQK